MNAVTPWVLVTVLSVYLSSFSAAGDLPERAGNLLAELADEQNSVGMAVAVVRDGEVDLIRTYGRLSADTDRLVNEDTVFRIASLSKGMTASVVAQLVGEEKVALTAHARDFAPEIQLETSGATEALTL
ncbi:MAG: serine hydrolase domain-containing protein, partial [Pseudomonadota bacterium]